MQRDQFEILVRRLETRFSNRPGALGLRLAAWVAIGYSVFLGRSAVAILLGLTALVASAMVPFEAGLWLLIAGGVCLVWAIFQTIVLLSLKSTPPCGQKLSRSVTPQLFSLLDELQTTSRRRVDKVLLTPELNAGVSQTPRLGVFGWNVRQLSLGLPLMEVLEPEEFRAVLVHEFAHLSGEHGRFGYWVYRLRSSWGNLFAQLQAPGGSTFWRMLRGGTKRFVDWYWPRFNARAFVLCRAHEYFADAASAQSAGPRVATSALWRIGCQSRRLDDQFWPDLWKQAKAEAQPPGDIIERLLATLSSAPQPAEATRWMDQVRRELTDHVDTHPCFTERALAMGSSNDELARQSFPRLPRASAAAVYLGSSHAECAREVSRLWQTEVTRNWQGRHAYLQTLERRVEGTRSTPAGDQSLSSIDLWNKASMILDMDGAEVAEPLLAQLLQLQPGHSRANLALGRYWLSSGRPEGAHLLERVLDGDEDEWIPMAGELLADHFRVTGQHERWQTVRARLDAFDVAVAASRRERSSVSAADRFLLHDLNDSEMDTLLADLQQTSHLFAAWLVRKELKHLPRRRLFVLCVRSETNWRGASSTYRDNRLQNDLVHRVRLPGQVVVVTPQGGFRSLARKVMRSPESLVFPTSEG